VTTAQHFGPPAISEAVRPCLGDLPATVLDETHTLELSLPPNVDGSRDVLVWETPLDVALATPISD
jgi:hypothetical protein